MHPFQSLLSQGISLLARVRDGCRLHATLQSFNPFLVRASVYWLVAAGAPVLRQTFQSLLSQGISLLALGPLHVAVRQHFEFQSLLSQGISLLQETRRIVANNGNLVSIPS